MEKIKIGELLKSGFEIVVKRPVLLVLGLFVALPSLFMQENITSTTGILGLISFLINIYSVGLIVRFLYESVEKRPSWRELNKFVLSKYILLLITFAIYGAMVFVGSLLLVIPGVFLLIRLLLCDYGILLEDDSVIASLKRSWEMTKGNWWRLFTLFFVCILPSIVFSFLKDLFPSVIFSSISFLITIFVFVWSQSTFILVYLELKKIKRVIDK